MNPSRENQDKIWDFFQNEGINSFEKNLGRQEYLVRRLKPSKQVLNIGVGNGSLEALAIKKGVDIWSLDPSQRAIDRLRETLGVAEKAQKGYSQSVPFPDMQFDIVIMSEVLEHLDQTDLDKTLSEVHRVLKPGGEFIGTVPARENLADSLVVCPCCGLQFHRWGHKSSFDTSKIVILLEQLFHPKEVFELFFISWGSTNLNGKIQGLVKKFLSRNNVGTYGTCRNIFFSAQKKI